MTPMALSNGSWTNTCYSTYLLVYMLYGKLNVLQWKESGQRKDPHIPTGSGGRKKAYHQGINYTSSRGAPVVMLIVVGNGYGDTSSNPGRDLLHFT